jgi:DNA repair exonuclease SbcCD nuclease subunit
MITEYSLVSDMHLDHPQPKTPYDQLKPLVIVAGDTTNGLTGLSWLHKLKNKGFQVFAVDGNHEHYRNREGGFTLGETETAFYKGLNQIGPLWLRDDLVLIGVNGWYIVQDEQHWKGYMLDWRHGAMSALEVNTCAAAHAAYIDEELSKLNSGQKAIIVTHTAPCEDSLDPRYDGHPSNCYFFNPHMTPLLAKHADRIHVWHHGHTHTSVNVVEDGVRIITNPRGYPGENESWAPLNLSA